MKISNEEVSRLLAGTTVSRTQNSVLADTQADYTPSLSLTPVDRVDVSTTAQDIVKAKRWVNEVPDVRTDRVAQLKAQIESGTYNVSGEDIADLIIRRTLADNTAL